MEPQNEIYQGPRNEAWIQVIIAALKRGKLRDSVIEKLLDQEGRDLYNQIFTSASADPVNNYEVYETLGDVTANKAIVWYMSRRFPQLMCPQGVKIIARLKINYASKEHFHTFANELGFWPYITATVGERGSKMKSLLEDSFEAFIGATEFLIDQKVKQGAGYAIAYNIVANILDGKEISLRYEDLFDANTRLKELFDLLVKQGRAKKYEYAIRRDEGGVFADAIWIHPDGRREVIGTGRAYIQKDAEQRASEMALTNLRARGIFKEVPEQYRKFCRY